MSSLSQTRHQTRHVQFEFASNYTIFKQFPNQVSDNFQNKFQTTQNSHTISKTNFSVHQTIRKLIFPGGGACWGEERMGGVGWDPPWFIPCLFSNNVQNNFQNEFQRVMCLPMWVIQSLRTFRWAFARYLGYSIACLARPPQGLPSSQGSHTVRFKRTWEALWAM